MRLTGIASFTVTLNVVLSMALSLVTVLTSADAGAVELKSLDVAILAPMSGNYRTLGQETCNITQLVFKSVQQNFAKLGYHVNIKVFDDQHSPVATVQQAQKIIQDKDIVAVLGSYNDDNSMTAASLFYPHKLGFVTLASGTSTTPNTFDNLNRVVAQQDVLAQVSIKMMVERLKIKSMYMVSDLNPDSSSLLDKLEGFGTKNKIEIKGRGRVLSDSVLGNIIKVVSQEKPDLVFYAGERPLGDKLLKQLRQSKVNVVYLGSNSLDQLDAENEFDGSGLETYYLSFAAPLPFYPFAKEFSQDYKKTFSKPLSSYGIMIHDAAMVLSQALLTSLQNNDGKLPTREQVKQVLRKTRFSSSDDAVFSGGLAFNNQGERKESNVFIYQVGGDGVARVVSSLPTSRQ
jgi:branched-chain amino acid transport system substrate-binding protein